MLDQIGETYPVNNLSGSCACRLVVTDAARRLLKGHEMLGTPLQDEMRRFPRFAAHGWAKLECQPTFPKLTRPQETHAVLIIDISRGGMGFLHSEQLYPGEQLLVTLTNGSKRFLEVACCHWIGTSCYLIGCNFHGAA